MKSKWIPWLVIMNVVFIIALISVVGILMIDKKEEVKTEDSTQGSGAKNLRSLDILMLSI
jgi:hypothetical protein